jgi:hypothetical protein
MIGVCLFLFLWVFTVFRSGNGMSSGGGGGGGMSSSGGGGFSKLATGEIEYSTAMVAVGNGYDIDHDLSFFGGADGLDAEEENGGSGGGDEPLLSTGGSKNNNNDDEQKLDFSTATAAATSPLFPPPVPNNTQAAAGTPAIPTPFGSPAASTG